MTFDQRNEILRRISTERRFAEMRIPGNEMLRPGVQVREVAAAAAGHQYFLADLVGTFHDKHATAALPGNDGAHEACGPAAKANNVKPVHGGNIATVRGTKGKSG